MNVNPSARRLSPPSRPSKRIPLLLFLSLAWPLEAASLPNLLVNGGFDGGLSGWSRTLNVQWSPALGGAARIDQPTHAGFEVLFQCAGVDSGALYRLAASAFLPQLGQGDGGLSVRVRWFDAGACQGAVLSGSPSLDFETNPATPESKSRVLVAPAGARSAAVQLVARADATPSYVFFVDEVSFSPEPVGELLTLPTAASAPGAHGQRFATDVWVRNTTGLARRFSLRMACPSPCGPDPTWVVLNLGPTETRFLPDIVTDVFGADPRGRAGAIEIGYDPREGAVEVFARVATSNADLPGNGTTIPARTRQDARTQAAFIGLDGLGGDAGFRVNAGAFNPNDGPTTVSITARDSAGFDLGTVQRTWAAREWFQLNDVLGAPGTPLAGAASLHVESDLPLFPFVIAIDNRSGDPTWLEPGRLPVRY